MLMILNVFSCFPLSARRSLPLSACHPKYKCCSCDTVLKQERSRMEGCYLREVSV